MKKTSRKNKAETRAGTQTSAPPPRRAPYLRASAAAVALATFLIYIPALNNSFVNWDDQEYLARYIRAIDIGFLKWAFFDYHSANWHPLTWISHAIDFSFWGKNPFGHHLTGVLIHSINALLVVLLCARLLEAYSIRHGGGMSDRAVATAGVAAGLLFGIHPLHVESAAWVSERKDLLCAFFYLLSILSYLRYAAAWPGPGQGDSPSRPAGRRYPGYSLLFFALALMSKPMAVSLPLVLLIIDWHPLGRLRKEALGKVLLEKAPFFALAAASVAITVFVQREAMGTVQEYPLGERVLVASNSIMMYLLRMAAPLGLSPFYPYPEGASLAQPRYLISVLALAGISIAAFVITRRNRLWLAVWSAYLLMLLPVAGIVQVGYQSMADRYTYLPSIGPFLLLGMGASYVKEKWYHADAFLKPAAAVAAAVALTAFLSVLTVRQIHFWKDSISLWNRAIAMIDNPSAYKNAHIPYSNLGSYYFKTRNPAEAIASLETAIKIRQNDTGLFVLLCKSYFLGGRFGDAVRVCEKAVALDPADEAAHYELGNALFQEKRLDEAIGAYQKVLSLNPENGEALYTMGNAYMLKDRPEEAAGAYQKAVALVPYMAEAHHNYGVTLLRLRRPEEAAKEFEAALRINPALRQAREQLEKVRRLP